MQWTHVYIRESQRRVLLQPVAEKLLVRWGKPATVTHLTQILSDLRTSAPRLPGYAAANLFHLLVALDIDLRGYNFSNLVLRQADLRHHNLAAVNLAGSDLTAAGLLKPMNTIYTMAFASNGEILVAGTGAGLLKVWRTADHVLLSEVRCHKGAIRSVQFNSSGNCLITAADQDAVRLWAVNPGGEILPWRPRQNFYHIPITVPP